MKYFPAGSMEAESYEGQRDLDDLVSYINSKAGTFRASDGSLLPIAGRILAIDDLIAGANFAVTTDLVEKIKTAAAVAEDKSSANAYISAAEKVVSKGANYVFQESARLKKMIESGSVKPASRTSFQLKQNILRAFMPSQETDKSEL